MLTKVGGEIKSGKADGYTQCLEDAEIATMPRPIN